MTKLVNQMYGFSNFFARYRIEAPELVLLFDTDDEFYKFHCTVMQEFEPQYFNPLKPITVENEAGHATTRFELAGFKVVAKSKKKSALYGREILSYRL